MKVLLADKFQASGLAALRDMGCEVTIDPTLQGDALRDAVIKTQCAVLIVRSTKVPKEVIEAADSLALIVRAGAGYNTIDVEAASQHSVMIANCPGKNAVAVAELTFALILALDRKLVDNVTDLRAGVWNKKKFGQARGLKGRTLGILGLGQIGLAVIRRAKAFGMPVVAWSRSLTPERAQELDITPAESPVAVARLCDILSVHIASSPETKGLVNVDVLSAMKPGGYLINTARADVVDYDAVASAIKKQELRVGLDVYPNEPTTGQADFSCSIMGEEGVVYGTHHIGASTEQAQEAIADEAVRIVRVFNETGNVLNCVNLRRPRTGGCSLRVRHLNKPGVLSSVLRVISEANINVEEMDNVICKGGYSATAQIKLESPIDQATITKVQQANDHIISARQTQIAQ